MNRDYIKLTNFNNDFTNQIASYMIMEENEKKQSLNIGSYEYKDIVHNSVYYLDRAGYISNLTLKESIYKACKESGVNPSSLAQEDVDKLVENVLKEYRGY